MLVEVVRVLVDCRVFVDAVRVVVEAMRLIGCLESETYSRVHDELLEAERVITEALIKFRGRKIVCKTLECACRGRESSF
jgi:hypothetical protein